MLLIEPISAITSWEDYEYQGHVALYIALKVYWIYCRMVRVFQIMIYKLRVKKIFL